MNRSWNVLAFLLVFSSTSVGISDGIGVDPRALDSTHRREAVEQRAGHGHADDHPGNCPHCQEEDDYDFWIGELGRSEPIFTGPHQYPFICSTSESGLGQPLVDNNEGIGNAVFAVEGDNTSEILGYSADCSIQTRVDYFYLATDGRFYPYDSSNPPADIYQLLIGGRLSILSSGSRPEPSTVSSMRSPCSRPSPRNWTTPSTLTTPLGTVTWSTISVAGRGSDIYKGRTVGTVVSRVENEQYFRMS